MIARSFGSVRGAVRLALSYPEVALRMAQIVAPDPADIRRLVFVCHGNICRSAFADVLSRNAGLNAISFGLSTSSGKAAYPGTLQIAASMGHDLNGHRTMTVDEYQPAAGDLLLAWKRDSFAESRPIRSSQKSRAACWDCTPAPAYRTCTTHIR